MITLRGLFRDLKFLIGCFVYLVKHYSLFSGLKFQGRQERIVYLLCNGPSLKNDMETIKKLKGVDFIVVNFMANDSLFWEIKPQYYTLMDPLFFTNRRENRYMERLEVLFDSFNRIDWEMIIFLPIQYEKSFREFSKINNPKIKIMVLNTFSSYVASDNVRHFCYRKGYAMPNAQTVAIESIFAMLNMGYSTIYLYGVDHTFLEGLKVNDKNELVHVYQHFYENEPKIIPVTDAFGYHNSLTKELQTIVNIFASHEQCRKYADHLCANIYNLTKGSQIDSYERR